MAKVFQLANAARTVLYDLRGGVLRLEGGTRQGVQSENGIQEAMMLWGEGTDANLLAASTALDGFRERTRRWHSDPFSDDSQWLEENAGTENPRRALLYSISHAPVTVETIASKLLGTGIAKTSLVFERSELWESLASGALSLASLSAWGGKWQVTSVPGDTDARIAKATFSGISTGGGPVYRLWAGIREKRLGTSGFSAVWELEQGVAGTDTAIAGESGASPSGSTNNKMRCTFATTPTMTNRVAVYLNGGGRSNFSHYIGKYLVLLRCKVSGSPATEVAVRLYRGYTGTPANSFAPVRMPTYVTNTNWDLVDLGTVNLPEDGFRYGDDANLLNDLQFKIYAELVAGTPGTSWLDLDAILLVPAERLLYVEGAAIQLFLSDPRSVDAITREDDKQLARAYQSGNPYYSLATSFTNWALPKGDLMMVLAGTRNGSHSLTDAVGVDITYYPRWFNYRV